jgi:chlorite dismutase
VSEARNPALGHFATYRLTGDFWTLSGQEREERASQWLEAVAGCADNLQVYLTGPLEAASDVLLWATARVDDDAAPARFFTERLRAEAGFRRFLAPVRTLWGMTRPSEYSKARSTQEIDPMAVQRSTYLIAYPFSKTAEWYLKGRDTRQGMMNEHIRLGKKYSEITQLLLYSFGLQDQEFVVVYETEDLGLFSKLVHELRDTEARRYTALDTPLHSGVRQDPAGWASLLR